MWTQQELVTAFLALSPAPATLSAGRDALNAQTQSVTVDVPVQSVAAYLGVAGELAAFLAWAAAPPTGSSAASQAAAAELAFAFEHPALFPTFAMTNATVAAQMQTWLADLVSPGTGITGPIDAADQTAILALASASVPVWQPAVGIAQLQNAQRAGLISTSIPVA